MADKVDIFKEGRQDHFKSVQIAALSILIDDVADEKQLTLIERRVLMHFAHLGRKSGKIYPSMDKKELLIKMSKDLINRGIKGLLDKKYLRVYEYGKNKLRRYEFNFDIEINNGTGKINFHDEKAIKGGDEKSPSKVVTKSHPITDIFSTLSISSSITDEKIKKEEGVLLLEQYFIDRKNNKKETPSTLKATLNPIETFAQIAAIADQTYDEFKNFLETLHRLGNLKFDIAKQIYYNYSKATDKGKFAAYTWVLLYNNEAKRPLINMLKCKGNWHSDVSIRFYDKLKNADYKYRMKYIMVRVNERSSFWDYDSAFEASLRYFEHGEELKQAKVK